MCICVRILKLSYVFLIIHPKTGGKKENQLISVDSAQSDLRSQLSQTSLFMDEKCEGMEK